MDVRCETDEEEEIQDVASSCYERMNGNCEMKGTWTSRCYGFHGGVENRKPRLFTPGLLQGLQQANKGLPKRKL